MTPLMKKTLHRMQYRLSNVKLNGFRSKLLTSFKVLMDLCVTETRCSKTSTKLIKKIKSVEMRLKCLKMQRSKLWSS